MVRAAKALGESAAVRVVPTLLALHGLPPEYKERRDEFVRLATEQMIPRVAGLAQAVDAYCERIGFSQVAVRALLEAATRHGLRVKPHAAQLSHNGGAALAAAYRERRGGGAGERGV